jgi:ferredoxin-NADP reductase
MAQFQTLTAQVVRSVPLSEFTKHLELEVKGVSRFGFVPGQWLSVKATAPDGEEFTRAYSIASPPSENGHVALCLNRVHEGFMSNYLCSLTEGAEVTFQGPFGNFILHPPLRDTIFIATGTGIAPFRSMLHALLHARIESSGKTGIGTSSDVRSSDVQSSDDPMTRSHQFWLLFGARSQQDIYYRDEFERLAAEHPNFYFLPTLSRPTPEWNGLRGYVQEHVKKIVGDRKDMHAYICGLDKMVKANRELLKSLGWERTSIRYEKYD